MNNYDSAHAIYLVLLLLMVGGAYLVSNRQSLGTMAQQALIWGLIFVGVIAAIGLWDDIRQTVRPTQSIQGDEIVLPRQPNGHYHLTAMVNGERVDFVVDTGASQIVLTQEDARRVGINTDELAYVGRANTANGSVKIAPVRLNEVEVGPIIDHDVRAMVNGGDMDTSLLGMTYLQRFSKVEISGNKLILSR